MNNNNNNFNNSSSNNNNNNNNYQRRQRGDYHHHNHNYHNKNNNNNNQEVHWNRSHYHKKPPLHDNWHPTVPSWEKEFCYSVGSVPWEKLLRTKKIMCLHENVIQWNDSAAEEAFHNAKSRFWAEINGLPCNISLPNPDTYIHEVDWNCDVDPELLLDLERERNEVSKEAVSPVITNQPPPPTGWDVAEDNNNKWLKDPELMSDRGLVGWGQNANIVPGDDSPQRNSWDNGWSDSIGWQTNPNKWENSNNRWKNNDNRWNNNNNRNWGTWGRSSGGKKVDSAGGWYHTSKSYREDRDVDRGWWRNG